MQRNLLSSLLFRWFLLMPFVVVRVNALARPAQLPRDLNALYAKAEEYASSSPDSLLAVAVLVKQEGDRLNDAAALVKAAKFRAQALWRLGRHQDAMQAAVEALELGEQKKIHADLPDIYAIIGNLHKEKANYDMALAAADKGLDIAEQMHDTISIIYLNRVKAMFTQGLGAIKGDTALIRKSLHMHLDALKLAESSPRFEKYRIGYYNNIAQVYVKRGEMDKALHYVTRGIDLAKKHRQFLSLTYGYTWLSQIYLHRRDYAASTAYLEEALKIARQLKNPFREMELSDYLAEGLESGGDHKRALETYRRYSHIRDSLRVLENVRQVSEVQVRYEAEKKDQRISALAAVNEIRAREIWVAMGGLIVFLGLSLFMIFQYRTIARTNRTLEESNMQIREQSDQMQVLMKELHHRVKNNLQTVSNLLSLQSNRLTDEDARESIRTGQQRIEAMSLIHKSLYSHDRVNMVDMSEYMTHLTESVMQSFGWDRDRLRLVVDVTVTELDIDMAMPLGLIVNEWITNSFKHAYQHVTMPELSVKIFRSDALYLEIHDNGPGFNIDLWQKPGNSFGLKLVKVLARQLDAKVTVTTQPGTTLALRIPVREPLTMA